MTMNFGFIKEVEIKGGSLVVGLDIGSTKICAVVGEESVGNQAHVRGMKEKGVNIIGVGTASSKGIKKGVITNIESIVDSIKEAVQNAEAMAGIEIKAVHMGITGGHIGCLSSHGVIAVKEKEIRQREVENVIDAAKAVAIPFDREMLHVIPVGFTVNGQDGITDPRGMGGVRLETNVEIITGDANSVQNLIRACQKAGLEVIDVVFQPLASAEAVLTQDEKDLGVAVIDIGGGITDLALYYEGNICSTSVLAIGGNNFTNDIAIGLRMPTREAEKIKRTHGCSMISLVESDEEIEIRHENGKSGRKIPRGYLVEILQPRAEELFSLVKKEITDKGFHKNMNSGVVLTGGAALMEGMDVMAENILELPVRIGKPVCPGSAENVVGSPVYAAGVGLALYGMGEEMTEEGPGSGSILTGIKTRMMGWVGGVLNL
jgi:cell division protein FtsA